MNISAKITGIKYTPLLCRQLKTYSLAELGNALAKDATFILKVGDNELAVSWWVSAKRTRSYPYARVYDSLSFSGKKVTIIPVLKDEGKDGDEDPIQWDTISLMSLLGVNVIIAYYITAGKSPTYQNKITKQRFDISYITNEIFNLISYQSCALHWNLAQVQKTSQIYQKAIDSYKNISIKTGVEMHPKSSDATVVRLMENLKLFMKHSRESAKRAQLREEKTVQPRENLSGEKASITINNYLGGYYYFTVDEAKINGNMINLVEGKHSKSHFLPSNSDIKDGLLKMDLFTNLENVIVNDKEYTPIPTLKLTVEHGFDEINLSKSQKKLLGILREEAQKNHFKLLIE